MNIVVRMILDKREEAFYFAQKYLGVESIPSPGFAFAKYLVNPYGEPREEHVTYLTDHRTIVISPEAIIEKAEKLSLMTADRSVEAFKASLGQSLVTEYSNHIVNCINNLDAKLTKNEGKFKEAWDSKKYGDAAYWSMLHTIFLSRLEAIGFFVGKEYCREKSFPIITSIVESIKNDMSMNLEQAFQEIFGKSRIENPNYADVMLSLQLPMAPSLKSREEVLDCSRNLFYMDPSTTALFREVVKRGNEDIKELKRWLRNDVKTTA